MPTNDDSENNSGDFGAHLIGGLVHHSIYKKLEKITPPNIFKYYPRLFVWKTANYLAASAVGYAVCNQVKNLTNRLKR